VSSTVIAGMAISSFAQSEALSLTSQPYSVFDDASTKLYGSAVANATVKKPRWLDQHQQHVWQAYRHLNQQLYAALEDQLMRDAGLSGADYSVLVPLSEEPTGVLRARELCTEIGWDRSRLSHHITRMEKRGLVAREECSEDGRGSMVRLTDAGRQAIEGAAPLHAEAVHRQFFDLVSDEEVETLSVVFDRLLENLTRTNV
jgi:DNA-binding MarR family transcriptional regulator